MRIINCMGIWVYAERVAAHTDPQTVELTEMSKHRSPLCRWCCQSNSYCYSDSTGINQLQPVSGCGGASDRDAGITDDDKSGMTKRVPLVIYLN